MKFKDMTATFGTLTGAKLTPGPGLNIITAPNERGKSTWAAFLTAMLYGIDTRERDKGGHLADKTRYQPWSGAPMEGELRLEWEEQDITLRRTPSKTNPFGTFKGVYTATGDPVPGLTATSVGQILTGVSREVFVRSALVGQNNTSVTAAPDLERRIAALATTGEEDVSYSATQRTLKDWRNRRRANRSTGLIPQLEGELAQVETALGECNQARAQQTQAKEALETLGREVKELEAEAALHAAIQRQGLNERYAQAVAREKDARAALEGLPKPQPCYQGLTPQQAREKYQQAQEKAQAAQERGEAVAQAKAGKKALTQKLTLLAPILGIGGLLLIIVGFFTRIYPLAFVGFGAMAAAVIAAMVLVGKMGKYDRIIHAPTVPTPSPLPPVEEYLDALTARQRLTDQLSHAQERVADLEAQGAVLPTGESLTPPLRSPRDTQLRLEQVRGELTRWQSQLDRATGALSRDPLELECRRDALQREIETRTGEYDALELALEGLEEANTALRERFSPALNREAGALFARMTGTEHRELTLARDFSAQVLSPGQTTPRSALFLSAGTMDQLYLAVRLALCRLTAPGVPLVLDDTLAAFDDTRMAATLELLTELGEEQQILLFTCHSREGVWARAHGVPVLEL